MVLAEPADSFNQRGFPRVLTRRRSSRSSACESVGGLAGSSGRGAWAAGWSGGPSGRSNSPGTSRSRVIRDGPRYDRQPLQQVPCLVLQEDRRAGLALQREHAALRSLGELQRLGDARDVRAHDLSPAQHEGCVQEAGAMECRRRVAERVLARRAGTAPPRRARTVVLDGPLVVSLHLFRQQ